MFNEDLLKVAEQSVKIKEQLEDLSCELYSLLNQRRSADTSKRQWTKDLENQIQYLMDSTRRLATLKSRQTETSSDQLKSEILRMTQQQEDHRKALIVFVLSRQEYLDDKETQEETEIKIEI